MCMQMPKQTQYFVFLIIPVFTLQTLKAEKEIKVFL